ncbi:hypothetical protein AQUCO_00600045v1 [Aquilegia coerulea]|uniref:Uncharacterized protein n=1 Tax=Aquilegia coerulea TaxID=218851 RepID=A0A2G5EMP2_AQUCA|nr:hypothetical protein AQUCO_00600045v1 [Aquilegia coerulea]
MHDKDLTKGMGNMGEIIYEVQGNHASDFVSVTFTTRNPGSLFSTELIHSIRMSKLEFYCNRPNYSQLGLENEKHCFCSLLSNSLKINLIETNFSVGEPFIFPVHPSSLSIDGTLGNFRLCDMFLSMDHCWGLLSDIRNQGSESLIKQSVVTRPPILSICWLRPSVTNSFPQLDLGQRQVINEFSWHGLPEKDPSAVHLDIAHAAILGVNMAVGIDGGVGKPMILEDQGLHTCVRHSLRDVFRKVLTFSIEAKITVYIDYMVQTVTHTLFIFHGANCNSLGPLYSYPIGFELDPIDLTWYGILVHSCVRLVLWNM